MKFSEIVGLQKYFQPVYNIDNETGEYWKQFIPNDKFYDILETTFNAVLSANGRDKLSIWMVGKYGTGKSHASGVIKNLLWKKKEKIDDYLNNSIEKHSIREKIINYRKNNKILPVVLIGGGNITDARTLSLEIERALKKALKKNNIYIQTKGDFERMIDKIHDNFLNWETIINDNIDLKMQVNDKNDIIKKLENEDIEILKILEKIFSKKGTHFSHEKISAWLKEVTIEIIKKEIADGIMIFWDEFTTILEKDKISEILNEIQSIAELSNKDNVYLYLISHRDYDQFPAIQETMNKVKGRFHTKHYPMISITAYQILSAAIQHKNPELWEKYKIQSFENNTTTKQLINELTNELGANTKRNIKNLYPIHPYTAHLSTFLARNLGSSQRSIFNFLYDNKNGFTKFLELEISENTLLTPDYIWDYYAEVLSNDPENRFMQVLERYNTYKQQIGKLGNENLSVFKGVLLLNSLYRITDHASTETEKVNPHADNIKLLFVGSTIENKVEETLKYLDKNEIIQKNPSNIYEIASTSLPRFEVDAEKEKLSKNQYKTILNIVEFENNKSKIESFFNSNSGVLRETRIKFFSSDTNEYIVKNNLNKNLKASYHLDFAIFLLLTDEEKYKAEKIISSLKSEQKFKHITFIIIKTAFGEKNYKDFIDYLAHANVYRSHDFKEESTKSENFANKIVTTWINSINYIQVSLNTKIAETRDISSFGNYINSEIAYKIFKYGIDTLHIKTGTAWKNEKTKRASEYVITANNRTELETKLTGQYSYIKDIFKDKHDDYIIDKNLEIKNLEELHPVIYISKEINKTIEKVKERATFNLSDELLFLTKPPYGIYTNKLNMALLGFGMRPFIEKLYTANEGAIVTDTIMRDKIGELFDCWQKNNKNHDKLNFRFGTEEEKELVEVLSDIFSIEKQTGIQQLRWTIKNKLESITFPLWSVKYTITDDKYQLKPIIDEITELVFSLDDTEINLELTNKILKIIKEKKLDLITVFNETNFKKGFYSFIKNVENVTVNDDEIENVLDYIRKRQQEGYNWKEYEVIGKIKDWQLEKHNKEKEEQKRKDEQDESKNNETTANEPETSYEKPKPTFINRVKNKINIYKGNTETFKSKLTKIIDKHPEFAEIIDKYFD